MKNNRPFVAKRLVSVLLALGMVFSCIVAAYALDLSNPFPTGSNPPATGENNNSEESSNALGRLGDLNETIGGWFVPTAPDQVKEAFGIADDDYAKSHKYCFAVNTSQNIVIAYKLGDDGTFCDPEKAFVCSCGLESSPTKKGVFKTSDVYRWRSLNGGVWGQWATRITGHYLFHSVPYKAKDPSTLKTAEYNKLGQNASEGCVRLSVKDAKWIQMNCPAGTIVYIYDGKNVREPLAKPSAVKIDPNNPNAGWDPTDPNANNPWKA